MDEMGYTLATFAVQGVSSKERGYAVNEHGMWAAYF